MKDAIPARRSFLALRLRWLKLLALFNLSLLWVTTRLFELIRGDAEPAVMYGMYACIY